MSLSLRVDPAASGWPDGDLRLLFHRLNNQLGVVLAHAELLETKAANDLERARATQVVASVLDALGTTRQIRFLSNLTDGPIQALPSITVLQD